MPSSFDYAVVRIVPSVEREEFFNAGVVLFCPEQRFLNARIHLNREKLAAFDPEIDVQDIQRRLEAIVKICAGDTNAGPIGRLPQRPRFHWLIAPRSTVVQVSPAHSGVCEEPGAVLDRLFEEQVRPVSVR
jgi:hypothetical protein